MLFAMFTRIVFAWGFFIDPYKTFFTDGVREGDWINEQYEYDHNYERDKFYNL